MFCILQKLPVYLRLIFLFLDILYFIHVMLGQACTIKDKEGANLVKAKYLRYSGMYEILYIENMIFAASGRTPGGNRICQTITGDKAYSLFSIWPVNFRSSNCNDKHEMKIRRSDSWQPLSKFAHLQALGEHRFSMKFVSQKSGMTSYKIRLILLLNYI